MAAVVCNSPARGVAEMSNAALRKILTGSVQDVVSGRLWPWMFYYPVGFSCDCLKFSLNQEASN